MKVKVTSCMGGDRFTYLPGQVLDVLDKAEAKRMIENGGAVPAPENAAVDHVHGPTGPVAHRETRSSAPAPKSTAKKPDPAPPAGESDSADSPQGVRAAASGAEGPPPGAVGPSASGKKGK